MRLTLGYAVPLLAGCSVAGSSTQVSGRIAPGFPVAITAVELASGSRVVASAPVAADGTFEIAVPSGTSVAFQLVGDDEVDVVFPRQTGGTDTAFTLDPGAGPFDLGALHYVGDASATTFVFHSTTGSGSGSGSGTCDADDHDGSGATCVDDGDDDGRCRDHDRDRDRDHDRGHAGRHHHVGDAVADHNVPAGCHHHHHHHHHDGDDDGSGH